MKLEIDTPALLVNLDLMERNITTLAEFFKGKKDREFRPHFKSIKTPAIAWKQLKSGANGISCAKLAEAEVLIAAGINDVLITTEVVGDNKIKRLIGLLKNAPELKVCVDNLENAKALSVEALRRGVKLGTIVEINVGQNRCGVEPGKPAAELAKEIAKLRGLDFKGIQAYQGSLQQIDRSKGMETKKEELRLSNERTIATKEAIENAGMNVQIATGGGTGSYRQQHEILNEVQPGSYPFMDWAYHVSAPEFECALTILTTVISKPSLNRAIVDAGWKSVSTDNGQPILKEVEGVEYHTAGDEHGVLTPKSPSREIKFGSQLELYPSHCCTTVNLYDKLYGIRDGEVEVTWDILARGKSQ